MNEQNEFRTLVIDDTEYSTRHTPKYERRRRYIAPDPDQLLAFIPGVIRTVYVKAGDRVRWGDRLLVLDRGRVALAEPRGCSLQAA